MNKRNKYTLIMGLFTFICAISGIALLRKAIPNFDNLPGATQIEIAVGMVCIVVSGASYAFACINHLSAIPIYELKPKQEKPIKEQAK